jgi:polyhydroxybutyrate depolymerase
MILLMIIAACHKTGSAEETGLIMKEITVDGWVRRYALYVPEHNGDLSLPLVFVLHGGGGEIENMIGETGRKSPYKLWMEIADREKLIILYPQALDGPAGRPNWNDCRANATVLPEVDDVRFITTLIDETILHYSVDTTRIFVTGISNGGIMTLRLATEIPQRLAAAAPICASLPDTSECPSPSRPLPILFMNGTADPLMPYQGGIINNPPDPAHGSVMPVDTAVKRWISLNQADTLPEIKTFPDLDPGDACTVTRYTYTGSNGSAPVILYRIEGGGHAAPSIREQYSQLWLNYVGPQNHDIEMAEEIWNFFRDK